MAEAVQIAGPVKIFVATPPAGTVELLGYSANGVDIEEESFFHDVPGDQFGGDVGPPIDVQFMGSIGRIRMELTKFDTAVFDKVRARLAAETAGTVDLAEVGTLMRGNTKGFRLHVAGTNTNATITAKNYPLCLVREAISWNMGARFTRAFCLFEAHANATTGVWQDGVTTGVP